MKLLVEDKQYQMFIIIVILFLVLIGIVVGELMKVSDLNGKYDKLLQTCPCYDGSGGQYSIGNFSNCIPGLNFSNAK